MTASATIMSLSARSLGDVEVPVPSPRQLDIIVRLVEASEAAYAATVKAVRLRRQTLRNAIIDDVSRQAEEGKSEEILMPLTVGELQSKLWQAADILRGQIDAADYKNYIFSLLFLKRLSDRFEEEVEAAVAAGVPRDVALRDADEHEFFVPESARWPPLAAASMNLGEQLNVASHAIEGANTPRLDGVLAGTNWNDESKLGSPANRERIIRSLIDHFGALNLRDDNLRDPEGGSDNVLGDAYEYLINRFADDAGKKGRGVLHSPPGRAAHCRAAAT